MKIRALTLYATAIYAFLHLPLIILGVFSFNSSKLTQWEGFLLRWYRAGADIDAKLPLLATYLGHGPAVSTHYYLHFIEPLRLAASERFAKHYGALVSPVPRPARRRG